VSFIYVDLEGILYFVGLTAVYGLLICTCRRIVSVCAVSTVKCDKNDDRKCGPQLPAFV
jgi:hypothetical protein